MGGGGGQAAPASAPASAPAKRRVGQTAGTAERQSLINRRGLEATKMIRNSLGGGMNLGGQ